VQQPVSREDFDAADANAAFTLSIGVSGVATPMGSNSSDVTAADAEAVALAPAIVHGLQINATSASPTIVTEAGEKGYLFGAGSCFSWRDAELYHASYRPLATALVRCLKVLVTMLQHVDVQMPQLQKTIGDDKVQLVSRVSSIC
jgi:hypothetical protein